jgi:transposase
MEKMINRLRKRLAIRDVVVVADRGMISKNIIKLMTQDKCSTLLSPE